MTFAEVKKRHVADEEYYVEKDVAIRGVRSFSHKDRAYLIALVERMRPYAMTQISRIETMKMVDPSDPSRIVGIVPCDPNAIAILKELGEP